MPFSIPSNGAKLRRGWVVQLRVIKALMIRELLTRFGRENFGFLWMMVEPLMFAALVGVVWTFMRGATEKGGITTAAFAATGYIPLTLFRHMVGRAQLAFSANGGLMYHRQLKLLDFILARFFIEMIGSMMAFLFISAVLIALGMMPIPVYPHFLLAGWGLYCLFTLSIALVLAPLSEHAEWLEKILPVTTYIMLPFCGSFTMSSWLTDSAAHYLIYSPFVDAMEMFRYGVFGDAVKPIYDPMVPIYVSLPLMALGLVLCRRVRRQLVI